MKELDERKVGTDLPVLISWSPKTDIFAIVYNTAQVSIYRMNWKKVFDGGRLKEGVADHVIWHPEGQHIGFIIKKVVYILEVDRGRLITKFNISDEISWVKWRSTTFEVFNPDRETIKTSLFEEKELPSTEEVRIKPKPEKGQINEQFLSILVFGCKNGHIYALCGGQVLLYHIKPTSSVARFKMLAGDVSSDLQCLDFLGQRVNKSDAASEHIEFTFKHFRNFILPPLTATICEMTSRFISLKSTWKQVVGQLNSMGDHWSKIYEIYDFYINHTSSLSLEESIAQYYELAINRVESVEIQVLLSAIGRDKEAKKNITSIIENSKGLSELISPLKTNMARCVYDSQLISQFMRRFSRRPSEKAKLRLLRKMEIIFQGLLRFITSFHCLSQKFSHDLFHFVMLLTYTIHLCHSSEYVTELFEIPKVVNLLDSQPKSNMFEFYIANSKIEQGNRKKSKNLRAVATAHLQRMLASSCKIGGVSSKSRKFSVQKETSVEDDSSPEVQVKKKKYSKSPSRSDSKSPRKRQSKRAGLTRSDWEFMKNVFRTLGGQTVSPNCGFSVDKLLGDVFKIPLVDLDCVYGRFTLFETDDPGARTVVGSDLWMCTTKPPLSTTISPSPSSSSSSPPSPSFKTHVFIQLNNRRMYLFEIDCSQNGIVKKSAVLTFSQEIISIIYFSKECLQVVSYDPDDKQENEEYGRTLFCRMNLNTVLAECTNSEPGYLAIHDGECSLPNSPSEAFEEIAVEVPTEVETPGPSRSSILTHVLPLNNICPKLPAVSGERKVGVLVSSDINRILLLDLDIKEEFDPDD